MIEYVRAHWPVDPARILLTGMSDGATFSWVCGLRDGTPFTHLAPVSGTFHPLLVEGVSAGRLAGLPVYLVHGSLDWMFPVEVARMARDTLAAAGADVTFREIADLSHTYPVEENARILEWFMQPR
jgi:phospholipase/carboxylesterase